MSLVEYDASSDEEENEANEQPESPVEQTRQENRSTIEGKGSQQLSQSCSANSRLESTAERPGEKYSKQSELPALALPDASMLLNSPTMASHLAHMTDHASRVAAAMAENESRKRDLPGISSSSYPRSKLPKGKLPHPKNIPDTVNGHLLPPQLSGRSNIVTEDLSKIFAKRNHGSSVQ